MIQCNFLFICVELYCAIAPIVKIAIHNYYTIVLCSFYDKIYLSTPFSLFCEIIIRISLIPTMHISKEKKCKRIYHLFRFKIKTQTGTYEYDLKRRLTFMVMIQVFYVYLCELLTTIIILLSLRKQLRF